MPLGSLWGSILKTFLKNQAGDLFFMILVPMCRTRGHPRENNGKNPLPGRPFGPQGGSCFCDVCSQVWFRGVFCWHCVARRVGRWFVNLLGSTNIGECCKNVVKHYSLIQKQSWGKWYKESTKRCPGGPKGTHLVTVWNHFSKQVDEQTREVTFQKNTCLGRRTKCLSRGYDTFRVPPRCQATPARWSHLERKTKGREQKT
jgi:hypothetical protein